MKSEDPVNAASNKVVLLIDDDEDDFDLFSNALHEIAPEFKAMLVTKGDNIIEYFESLDEQDIPCLVITDLNLPPSNGFEVIAMLKQDQRFSHLPVVVYSNSANPRDIVKAKEAGATAYVHKAASIEQITQDVKEMMRYALPT
jgi:CheY-like chemotaxis protein